LIMMYYWKLFKRHWECPIKANKKGDMWNV
jgi:hypothetical protein